MRTNGTDNLNGGGGGGDGGEGSDHRVNNDKNKFKHSGSMQTLTKGQYWQESLHASTK